MADTYKSGLISDFWTSYRQRKATGGRDLTSGEMRGLTQGLLANQAQLAMAAGERHEQRRQFDIIQQQKAEALEREKEAAQAQGLVNVGATYGQYKVGMATADALKAAKAGDTTAALTGAATQAGAGASTVGAAGEGLVTTGGGELSGSLVPGLGAEPAVAGSTTFATPSVVAEADAAAAAAGSAGGSTLGATFGKVAGPAGLVGSGAAYLLRNQSELVQAGGAGLAGGIAGYIAAGSAGGPVGFIIGAAIGVAVSFIDDISMVCTELHDRGYLDTKTYRASTMYTYRMADAWFYEAYLSNCEWIVPKMRKSKWFFKLMVPIGRGLAKEAAHRWNPSSFPKGSIIGKAVEKYLSAYIRLKEVSRGTWATRSVR